MVKGEPVFQATDAEYGHGRVAPEPSTEKPTDDPYQSEGRKIIPEVSCGRIEWDENGDDHRTMSVEIENRSELEVMLDKFSIFGHTTELDFHLMAGREREFNVYRGPELSNRSYTKAQLFFRLENGDYFCAEHEIRYNVSGDGENVPTELRLIRPIRDI